MTKYLYIFILRDAVNMKYVETWFMISVKVFGKKRAIFHVLKYIVFVTFAETVRYFKIIGFYKNGFHYVLAVKRAFLNLYVKHMKYLDLNNTG